MRGFIVAAASLTLGALGVVACGAITGLGAYSVGSDDASDNGSGDDSPTGREPTESGTSSGGGDDLEMTDDTSDAVAIDEAGDDAVTQGADGASADGGEPVDAPSETPDVATPQEGGSTIHDAATEASPPPCSTASCGGCCNSSGMCVGGQSTGTCGTGGVSCRSCSGSTPACSSGTCVAEPMEASAPTCTQAACTLNTLCIPVYTVACCKSDNTCGCEVAIPPSNNCQ